MFLSLALTLPASIQAELGLLRGSLDDVHWMQAEQCLIPLQNLGHITSRHQMEELDMALSHFRWEPFLLSLHQVAHQMGETEDRLTIGLTPRQPIIAFQKRLSSTLRQAGFPPPRRLLVPELTIARLAPASPTDLVPWIQRHNLFHSSEMMVDHITLLEQLHTDGSTCWRSLEDYPASPEYAIPSLLSPLAEDEDDLL